MTPQWILQLVSTKHFTSVPSQIQFLIRSFAQHIDSAHLLHKINELEIGTVFHFFHYLLATVFVRSTNHNMNHLIWWKIHTTAFTNMLTIMGGCVDRIYIRNSVILLCHSEKRKLLLSVFLVNNVKCVIFNTLCCHNFYRSSAQQNIIVTNFGGKTWLVTIMFLDMFKLCFFYVLLNLHMHHLSSVLYN